MMNHPVMKISGENFALSRFCCIKQMIRSGLYVSATILLYRLVRLLPTLISNFSWFMVFRLFPRAS